MISAIDHVQLAAPPGCEAAARAFFGDLLGLEEIEKPESLRARGGVWFRVGAQQLHVGVETNFSPARKAHPAFSVSDYDELLRRLAAAGVVIREDDAIPGVRRCYVDDPWRNRIAESSCLQVESESTWVNTTVSSATPTERLLIVDDEPQILDLVERLLADQGYECLTAPDASVARRLLAETPVALVLSDVSMPGESGMDFTREVLAKYPDTAVVMVTGLDDRKYADAAIELGAYGYVLKPFKPNELIINVRNALRRRALEIESRDHRDHLEQTVLERTGTLRDTIAQLESSDAELRRLREETIRRLSTAAEFRNQETGEHIIRMSLYSALLARLAGLGAKRSEEIRIASPMHDVGKLGIPDQILLKPGRLTAGERRVMEGHTEMGYRILAGSGVELLDLAAEMALTHHERIDGTGYPRGLADDEIPLEGRIVAIADVFDALTSDRVYRSAYESEEAQAMMAAGRGKQFDADLLDLFFGAFDDVVEIMHSAGTPREDQSLAVALWHAAGRARS